MKIQSASDFSKAARIRLCLVVSCVAFLVDSVGLGADTTTNLPPRALAQGKLPNDRRLEPLKDLDGYFPFAPQATPKEWDARARQVRRELAVALGLWPMPDKTPLNAVIHGKIEQTDYTIEKVHFESLPGFFVTGNLYRPKGGAGRLPAVLSPHGHWRNGRFMDSGLETFANKSTAVRKSSKRADAACCNRAACNWRAWAAWSFITT